MKLLYKHRREFKNGFYRVNGRVVVHLSFRKNFETLVKTKGRKTKVPLYIPLFSFSKHAIKYHALCRANPDALLFFDYLNKLVSRLEPIACYDDKYIDLRKHMQKVINAPDFFVSDDKRRITEDFLEGEILKELPFKKRLHFAKIIFADLLKLSLNSNQPSDESYVDTIIEDSYFLKGLDYLAINKEEARRILLKFPMVPSHGDFGTHHILTNQDNYYIIDWDYVLLSYRPSWYDLMSIFETDMEMKEAWWRGEFDDSILVLKNRFNIKNEFILKKLFPLAWSVVFNSIRGKYINYSPIRAKKSIIYWLRVYKRVIN
jgi:hypothetical protein